MKRHRKGTQVFVADERFMIWGEVVSHGRDSEGDYTEVRFKSSGQVWKFHPSLLYLHDVRPMAGELDDLTIDQLIDVRVAPGDAQNVGVAEIERARRWLDDTATGDSDLDAARTIRTLLDRAVRS